MKNGLCMNIITQMLVRYRKDLALLRSLRRWHKSFYMSGMLAILGLAVLGCTQYVPSLIDTVQDPPALLDVGPRLSGFSVTPTDLYSGQRTTITISFRYMDLDGDVNPSQVLFWRSLENTSDSNFDLSSSRKYFVTPNAQDWKYGFISVQIIADLPYGVYGTIQVTVEIYDGHGNGSNQESTTLAVHQ